MVVYSGKPDKLVLIKPKQLVTDKIKQYYGDNFIGLDIPDNGKARKDFITDLKETIPAVTKCIICADTEMFKALCHVKKTSGLDGIPCKTDLGIPAFIMPNWISVIYNPVEVQARLGYINQKINEYLNGTYKQIGDDIVHSCVFPKNRLEVKQFLASLHNYNALTCDIETASNHFINLEPKEEEKFKSATHHFSNRLYSIAFAWDKHNGGAFLYANDYKDLLLDFFRTYKGKVIYHNASFDITQLIYHLFMLDLEDYTNMLTGLHCMCRDIEDTMLIAYLAKNSCNKPDIGLKPLSHEYSGNYAEDVSDVTKVEPKKLLTYNLKDVLSTWFVYEKYYPKMVEDNQEKLYKTLFLPSLKTIIETQLVGLRIKKDKLKELSDELQTKYESLLNTVKNNPKVKQLEKITRSELCSKYNKEHKKKQKIPDDFTKESLFNPGSTNQIARLLYDLYALPVLDLTDKGCPACGIETINKLINHAKDDETKELLETLAKLSAVSKILSSFIPAFDRTPVMKDGTKGLYGSFKLGGTKSGRLASANPNLQNLPSTGSPYAKPVKKIFGAPKGYVFIGSDFSSLEDRISALTTRDPNKELVYLEGFDGHCLRAYSYFGNQMPDIHMAEEGDTVYKVTLDDGTVIYCNEEELKELQND